MVVVREIPYKSGKSRLVKYYSIWPDRVGNFRFFEISSVCYQYKVAHVSEILRKTLFWAVLSDEQMSNR